MAYPEKGSGQETPFLTAKKKTLDPAGISWPDEAENERGIVYWGRGGGQYVAWPSWPCCEMHVLAWFNCLQGTMTDTIGSMSAIPISPPKQHVTATPGVCGGKPCIAGTRVRVWDIAVRAQSGQSPDEILSHFPHLTLSDVHAALAYFYDNRQAIEEQAAEDERFAEQFRQSAGAGRPS